MGEVGGHAEVVPADEVDDRPNVTLGAFNGRVAVCLPVLKERTLQERHMGAVVLEVPRHPVEHAGYPPALRFEEGHGELWVKLEDAADHHGDQGELHLGRVTGDVAHEAVRAEPPLDVGEMAAGALVEAEGNLEFLEQREQGVPMFRVPVLARQRVGTQVGADGAELAHAPHKLLAGEVNVVDRQHARRLQAVRAMAAKVVEPIVVRPGDGVGQQRVEVGSRDEVESGAGEQHRDVDALDVHALDEGRGVVAGLEGEQNVGVLQRSGQGLVRLVVLEQHVVGVVGFSVDEPPLREGLTSSFEVHRRRDS